MPNVQVLGEIASEARITVSYEEQRQKQDDEKVRQAQHTVIRILLLITQNSNNGKSIRKYIGEKVKTCH